MSQPENTLVEVNDGDFEDKVLNASQPVLVDFWAEWCGPCRALGPVIESLSQQYGKQAVIAKLDVDANQETAMKYGIRSIPTVLLFNQGQIVESFIGVRPPGDYAASIDAQLQSNA
jgi:thioredoxin 1